MISRVILALAAQCLALSAVLMCGGCGSKGERALNVVGSTSIQPFAELLAQEYEKKNTGKQVDVQGGGSTAGLQAVANDLADVGMCSRSLKADEITRFSQVVIARDGIAIVVNKSNPMHALTLDQIREIFAGRITDWKEMGGKPGPIRPITREEGSGTRESFVHLVMGKDRISRKVLTQESNGAVKELVKGDTAAIGYMSLGLVGEELSALVINNAAPTSENVLAGTYTLSRPFLFVTDGEAKPDAQKFIDFVLSDDGQCLLEMEGLVRVR